MASPVTRKKELQGPQSPVSGDDKAKRVGIIGLSAVAAVGVLFACSYVVCDVWQDQVRAAEKERGDLCEHFEKLTTGWRRTTAAVFANGTIVEEKEDSLVIKELPSKQVPVCQQVASKVLQWPYCLNGDRSEEEEKSRRQQPKRECGRRAYNSGKGSVYPCYKDFKPSEPSKPAIKFTDIERIQEGIVEVPSNMPGAPVAFYRNNYLQSQPTPRSTVDEKALHEQFRALKVANRECMRAHEGYMKLYKQKPIGCSHKQGYR
ncbi:MAG: hypothetical protein FJZ63_02060 [Chlamydiae bacterium]|nr:hypothetical protein [Chlamydiota bacterium]